LRNADPQIGEQREFRGVVQARLVIELIDPQQDGAADDQREAHDPRIEQHFLDVFPRDQADDDGGQERHHYADHEPAIIRVGKHAARNARQFREIDRQDCENGAELNQNRETVPEAALPQIEEPLRQQQMARRRHREKFSDALDNAENYRSQ
jgi:hypothetical protein